MGRSLAIALGYIALGLVGVVLATGSGKAALIWPAAGFSVFLVLRFGIWTLAPLGLGAVVLGFGAGFGPVFTLFATLATLFPPLVMHVILGKVPGFERTLRTPSDVLWFMASGAIAGAAASGLTGTFGELMSGQASGAAFIKTWITWWLGDALGILIVAPCLLTLPLWPPLLVRPKSRPRAIALSMVVLLGGTWVYTLGTGTGFYTPLTFIAFLLVFWAAMRFYLPGASAVVLVLSTFTVMGVYLGNGPFAAVSLESGLMGAYGFLFVLSTGGLLLGAALSERRLTQDRLARANEDLEARIARKTADLSASEARYRALFEHTQAVGLLIDPANGDIVDANRAAASYYGYPTDRLRQMKISDINMLSKDEVAEEMVRAKAELRNYFLFKHQLASGEVRNVEVHSGPVEIMGRSLLYSVVHDITARIQAERNLNHTLDELTRINVELERFAYVASHDLQEPVRTIVSFSQLLGRRHGNVLNKEAREYLDYITAGAERMGDLVRDLLTYSRIANQESRFEPVDLGEVLAVTKANLDARIRESGALIEEANLPIIQGDRIQLIELMQNLIGNALKFQRPETQPEIRISARRKGLDWTLSVQDNGIGIEAQYKDQIFVAFKRLHGTQEFPGTGIGLAVCSRIVERHGGEIWVDSKAGVGTTFHFTLPALPEKDGGRPISSQ
ncbi:ATP-binding protein [Magnetospira sp. QH-2]|uniref:ATP-binding protein n=1 Tax=Magnetospira sp. (strain QH-2) TaxID=1288970 RepID=UPI0006986F5E|nr:ATP-binding protein [Magnetospira sp. QH-2]